MKKIGTLDQLLDHNPPVSAPFKARIGDVEIEVAFKQLAVQPITDSNVDAERVLSNVLKSAGLSTDLLAAQVNFRELEREQSCALLAEALVDPNSENGRAPAFSYERLRERLLPWQAEILDQKWAAWETRNNISEITDEDIDALIEAEKKSDESAFISTILDCASPVNLIHTLVGRLASSETSKS
jgi:hypothetical protein